MWYNIRVGLTLEWWEWGGGVVTSHLLLRQAKDLERVVELDSKNFCDLRERPQRRRTLQKESRHIICSARGEIAGVSDVHRLPLR